MASEPVPEPLTNQEVKSEAEAGFPASTSRGPELVAQSAPPIPAERELPRSPRAEEWKGAVQQKLSDAKQAASRATESASQAVRDATEQATAVLSEAKDRAADIYRDSRDKAAGTLNRARTGASYAIHEYPLQIIAGVAVVAFITGVLLRVWRSSRDA